MLLRYSRGANLGPSWRYEQNGCAAGQGAGRPLGPSHELFLMARDWRTWAETERDPEKVAKLNRHGDRCEALAKSAHRREVEAKAAKAKRSKAPAPKSPRPRRRK